jgi:hypothetical protein
MLVDVVCTHTFSIIVRSANEIRAWYRNRSYSFLCTRHRFELIVWLCCFVSLGLFRNTTYMTNLGGHSTSGDERPFFMAHPIPSRLFVSPFSGCESVVSLRERERESDAIFSLFFPTRMCLTRCLKSSLVEAFVAIGIIPPAYTKQVSPSFVVSSFRLGVLVLL